MMVCWWRTTVSKRLEFLRFQRHLNGCLLATSMLLPSPIAIAEPDMTHSRNSAEARLLAVGFAGLTPAAQGGFRIRASVVSGTLSTAGNYRLHSGALAARIARGDALHRNGFETASAP